MKEVQYLDSDFLKPKDAWDKLSLREKAEMMKVAIRNGITNLKEIREKYNEFAEGGSFTSLPDNWTMEQEARYQQWREALPENLKDTDDTLYDMRRAFVTGIPPTLESDGYYHLGSRDPETGRILKAPHHPAYLQAIIEDAQMGYYPSVDDRGITYTNTWDANRRLTEEPNLFKKGGYTPSESIKKRISKMEGAAMTGAKDPLSGKYRKNRSFEAEADSFYHALPDSIKSQVLNNPELADNLFSYSYNVGAGNFKKRVVPALERYYLGDGSAEEIAGSMWASGDKKLRGLRNRRTIEKNGVLNALTPTFMSVPVDDNIYFNPFAQSEVPITPVIVPEEAVSSTEAPAVEQIERPVDPLGLLASYTQLLNSSVPQNEPESMYIPVNAPYVVRGLGGNLTEPSNLYWPGGFLSPMLSVNWNKAARKAKNLLRYSKGYLKHKLLGDDEGTFIDLSDKNVARIKGNTNNVSSILTNNFVEKKKNTVRKKKDFVHTNDTLLGDSQIPLSNISTYYGIEDSKLKAGDLSSFRDETTVIPNRTQNTGRLKKVLVHNRKGDKWWGSWLTDEDERVINEYNQYKGYTVSDADSKPSDVLKRHEGKQAVDTVLDTFRKGITERGDTIVLPELNATPKMLFANEAGNAAFVSNLRTPENVERLNEYLAKYPSYPIMVDNGRYVDYQVESPDVDAYSGLDNPDSMFIVGTTKALGGNLYEGTSQPTQKMQIGLNVTNGWPDYTLGDILANAQRIQERKQTMHDALERSVNDYLTTSNDATTVANGRPQNQHLTERAIEGAKANAAWEKDHPNLTQWSYLPSMAVLGTAVAPLIGGLAETSGGAALTKGLEWLGNAAKNSPIVTNSLSKVLGTETLLPWADAAMTAGFGTHGMQKIANGEGISPETALDISPLFGRIGVGLLNEGNKLAKYSRLERNYTGVPHRQARGTSVYMDESFPSVHNNHTVWATDDVDYARMFTVAEDKDKGTKTFGTVFDVYTDPKAMSVLETPSVPDGQMVYWQGLPYRLKDGKVSYADNITTKENIIPKTKDIAINNRNSYGYYDFDDTGEYIWKDGEGDLKIYDWKVVPGAVTTDDVVKYSKANGLDATRFNRVYDGGVTLNDKGVFDYLYGNYYDYPINELILNPGAQKYVLPHGTPKWKLYKQLPEYMNQSKIPFGLFPVLTKPKKRNDE